MSTSESPQPESDGVSPVLFTAVLASVGGLVGVIAIIMIIVFIMLCIRELFRHHAKRSQETDRVGLLNEDQVAIGSDQEEDFTSSSMDQHLATVSVRVDQAGGRKKSPSVLSNGSRVSPMDGQTTSVGQDPSSSFRRRKLVQETSEDDEDVTCTRIDDVEDPVGGDDRQMLIGTQGGVTRKVRTVDQAEMQLRAQRMGRSLSFMRSICKSSIVTPEKMSQLQYQDSGTNPLVVEYKNVPTNAVDHLDLLPEEKPKNRYRNVLPNPHSRVMLSNTGAPGSTYINANFIRNLYGEDKAYIAAQGPVFDTMNDFWRMVWEQNVSIIVMLTNLIERGRHKCVKYWPSEDTEPMLHGSMEVVNTGEEKVPTYYTMAALRVKNMRTGEQRMVYHFWCTAWPDFGIPKETDAILKLRTIVNSHRSPDAGPVVVHCSAGLGRSGTFIAIDMGIQQYESEGVVDPLKYLCEMRQDRGGMIQTSDQYLFVHKTLADNMQ